MTQEMKVGYDVDVIVDSYEYLGHKLKLSLENQTAEISRILGLGWAALGKLRYRISSVQVAQSVERWTHRLWLTGSNPGFS